MNKNPSRWQSGLLLAPSTLAIAVFVVIPFVLIAVISFSLPQLDGSQSFGLGNYQRFLSSIFMRQTAFSIGLALLVSVLCLMIAVPFTYFLVGFSKRVRTLWLVFVLAQLSLSEVLIAFSWQVLLSRTTGVTNLFVWLGVLDKPFSLVPSFWAMLIALLYMAVPFAVLVLFPVFSRLDRSLVEASRTMGASSVRAFFDVVLPISRPALVTSGIIIYVLTLGAIIVPQLLGKPQHWTLAVHVTDQAIYQFNTPFAAALAVILLAASAAVLVVMRLLASEKN